MQKKVILFDFDGTLADSFESFFDHINELAKKYNFKVITKEEVGLLREESAKNLFKIFKIPFYKIPFIARDYKKMQQINIAEVKPFPEIPNALKALQRAGYTLGILTSNSKENVEVFLKKHKLELFTYIFTDSSIFGKDKSLNKFMKSQKVSKENIIYVGDEIRDIEACKKVRVKMVAVSWGFNSRAGLMKYNPDTIIDLPSQLITVIK